PYLLAAELEAREPPDDNVLAHPCNRFVDQFPNRLARVPNVGLVEQRHVAVARLLLCADATRVGRRDLHGDFTRKRAEIVGAGNEVGLAVELDHGANPPRMDVAVDQPLARFAAGPLRRLRQTALL